MCVRFVRRGGAMCELFVLGRSGGEEGTGGGEGEYGRGTRMGNGREGGGEGGSACTRSSTMTTWRPAGFPSWRERESLY